MNWRPNAGVAVARARAEMLERVRRYFAAQVVLEVETPLIVTGTATDPQVDSLAVESPALSGYLQTSPEHAMKRLLAAGYPDIFQVCKVFRAGESGPRHRPEFTMIEWYRRGFGLEAIVGDAVDLVAAMLGNEAAASAGVVSYRDAFIAATGLDPIDDPTGDFADCLDADDALRESLGDDRNAWLDLTMSLRVAPSLPADRLTAVRHYPAGQAALARICPDDDALADRFELFWGSLEVANGFVELTDPDEQSRRFESEREARRRLRRDVPEADSKLIDALRHGLPQCAGVALGLDRILMIDQGLQDIGATLTFDPGT